MDEQDFSKAEIAKEKKTKVEKFKEKTSLEEFLPSGRRWKKIRRIFEFRKMRGDYDPLVGHWSKAKSHLLTPWY